MLGNNQFGHSCLLLLFYIYLRQYRTRERCSRVEKGTDHFNTLQGYQFERLAVVLHNYLRQINHDSPQPYHLREKKIKDIS